MTREEAIEILKAIRVYECYPKSASEETKEALDMAIEALQTEAVDVNKAHEEEHLTIINRINELQYAIAKTQTVVGKMVESAEAVEGEWIPCSERLPKEKQEETIYELGEWLEQMIQHGVPSHSAKRKALATAIALLSADAVQGWRTGKPKKQGEYIATVKSMRGGMVELFYYGKPMMPNCKVKGMCWYRSDDEWGDVVYDDADILAWMPLPEPYREDGEV